MRVEPKQKSRTYDLWHKWLRANDLRLSEEEEERVRARNGQNDSDHMISASASSCVPLWRGRSQSFWPLLSLFSAASSWPSFNTWETSCVPLWRGQSKPLLDLILVLLFQPLPVYLSEEANFAQFSLFSALPSWPLPSKGHMRNPLPVCLSGFFSASDWLKTEWRWRGT